MEYLGHVVSAKGVRTDPKKTKAVQEYPTPINVKEVRSFVGLAVQEYPTPINVKEVRSFVGLASYYQRFIPHFARVAGPLHTLTKKDVTFVWTPECQSAFEKLKKLAPILVYLLETDTSGAGLGAVLAQRQDDESVRPVAYASRSLQPRKKNYGITEMEGVGVIWAAFSALSIWLIMKL